VNGETSSEDLTILATLEALETGAGGPGGGAHPPETSDASDASDASEMMARLYNEVLGLVAYELEPVAPSPQVKTLLMARIVSGADAAEEADGDGDDTQPAPVAVTEPAPIPPTPPIPVAPILPIPPPTPPIPLRQSQEMRPVRPPMAGAAVARRSPRRWPLALAASLSLLLLGLSGYLYSRSLEDRATIARLDRDLARERSQAAQASAQASRLESYSLNLREKMALVTSPTVAVSALRPMGRPPLQPGARGLLFVAADHQHWYLSLQGLQPVEGGRLYKLWFMADQGPVDAGSFTVLPGAPIEMSSKEMPAGTRTAVITLETDPGSRTPSGPEVLRAGAIAPIS
jgi:hypothetical protein